MNIPEAMLCIARQDCVRVIERLRRGEKMQLPDSFFVDGSGLRRDNDTLILMRLMACGLVIEGYPVQNDIRLSTIAFRELGNHIARMGIWQADAADDYPTPPMGIKRS